MMSATEREAWLSERKKGIGGSEVGHLLQPLIDGLKYSCRRELWYRKSQIEPDFPEDENPAMKIGSIFEAPLLYDFSQVTGYHIESPGRLVHPEYPELGVTLDSLVYKPNGEVLIAEAKNQGSRNFYETKRNGVIKEYLLQACHGALIAGAKLGIEIKKAVIVIGRADSPELIARALDYHLGNITPPSINPDYLLHFEIDIDPVVCSTILREGPAFWKTLRDESQKPTALEPDDPRCGSCAWRVKCHGAALAPRDGKMAVAEELTPLALEYIERHGRLKEATEAEAETKELIRMILGDREAVYVPVNGKLRPLYNRLQDGKPLHAEALEKMGQQFRVMRDRLIALGEPGAELIPMPADYIGRGEKFRVLRCGYLDSKVKE